MIELSHILSTTESLCPECLKRLPANRVAEGDVVFLEKTCPEHGTFRTKIWEGGPSFETWQRPKIPGTIKVPFTELNRGCPFDCGLCSEHHQHTCTAVIEVTSRCNLHCTFCFADAGGTSQDPDQGVIKGWYQGLLNAGGPCNIQISGGEPTLRKDLPQLVAMGRSMGFGFIQVNTNGLRLSRDRALLEDLKSAGLASLFLQFDGTEPEIYERLRGRNILPEKLRLIQMCAEVGMGVVLVPTVVSGINDHNLSAIIDFAIANMPQVKGVHFQPVSYFGRIPTIPSNEGRLTLPEVITRLEQQTQGRIKANNFRPPGCENALCSFHGNFILTNDGTLTATTKHQPQIESMPVQERAEEGSRKAKEFIANRWRIFESESREQCGCESSHSRQLNNRINPSQSNPIQLFQTDQPKSGCSCSEPRVEWDSMDLFLKRSQTHTLAISAMAFQDVWNMDLERLRDCCIHTVAPDGKLIPFCAYNLTNAAGKYIYRRRETVL